MIALLARRIVATRKNRWSWPFSYIRPINLDCATAQCIASNTRPTMPIGRARRHIRRRLNYVCSVASEIYDSCRFLRSSVPFARIVLRTTSDGASSLACTSADTMRTDMAARVQRRSLWSARMRSARAETDNLLGCTGGRNSASMRCSRQSKLLACYLLQSTHEAL